MNHPVEASFCPRFFFDIAQLGDFGETFGLKPWFFPCRPTGKTRSLGNVMIPSACSSTWRSASWGASTTRGPRKNEKTYPTKREVWKIIDSDMPWTAGMLVVVNEKWAKNHLH